MKLKEIENKTSPIFSIFNALRNRYILFKLKLKKPVTIFTEIHRSNAWHGKDSLSGTGSDIHQTSIIVRELPNLFAEFNISTMLDIPCGDFHWMNTANLKEVDYTGADIVEELIRENSKNHAAKNIQFQHLNLINDKLEKVGLVFCRDCLVHLSFKDISRSLDNICNSQSEYLLTTTFTDITVNHDIITGQWRVLNLQIAPFNFPDPIKIIHEECTENNGIYKDKAMGLWKISEIKESLQRSVKSG